MISVVYINQFSHQFFDSSGELQSETVGFCRNSTESDARNIYNKISFDKPFQQLLLQKDMNLDFSLEIWLWLILDISDLCCLAAL